MVKIGEILVKFGQVLVKIGQQIWVFFDKDFLDWPRPPPFLAESKKETVFYAYP